MVWVTMAFMTFDNYRKVFCYHWDLLYVLVRRDLKSRYAGTILGFAWTLIMPCMQLGIFYFIFKVVLEVEMRRFSTFVFIGIISYTWFQSALSQTASSIVSNRDIALRPGFPLAILPGIAVASSMLHFIFSLPVILILILIEGQNLSLAVFWVPIVMAVQFFLCLGIGYLTALVNIIYRDTASILDVLLRLFFFLTPIFYDPQQVPEEYRWLYDLNPMVTLLQAYRDVIMNGVISQGPSLSVLAIVSVFLAWIGFRTFQKRSYRLIDLI